ASTTPEAMFIAGKHRIPPRNWDATKLWVTKKGNIGDGKFLFLVAPLDIQSDARGRVALFAGQENENPNGEYYVKLDNSDFTAASNPGEDTAKVWIRGHLTDKTVYQTQVGNSAGSNAGQLKLKLYEAADITKLAMGKLWLTTQGFSVAAIPITIKQAT